jgi:hypothetical protein
VHRAARHPRPVRRAALILAALIVTGRWESPAA